MSQSPCSLTVFLGGAGMIGDYNQDMVKALTDASGVPAVSSFWGG